MGLPLEPFTQKKAMPTGILPLLTDKELELFTGCEYRIETSPGKYKTERRDCQRIEINAIPVRERAGYLERKIAPHFQKTETLATGEVVIVRPDPDDIRADVDMMIKRTAEKMVRVALKSLIDLDAIVKNAANNVYVAIDDAALQAAIEAEPPLRWRDAAQHYVDSVFFAEPALKHIVLATDRAIDTFIENRKAENL